MRNPSLYSQETIRVRCLFTGVVQGVGFRPFIYRTAVKNGLSGFVKNTSDGVVAEVEGLRGAVGEFLKEAHEGLPPLADVTRFEQEPIRTIGDKAFHIVASLRTGKSAVHIAPDIAVCDPCTRELFDPRDRRFRYPFINCTDCGPRLTIIRDIPYDREKTSMSVFPLCPECRAEYEDPSNRRFHAEPNACPVCGPGLSLLDEEGARVESADPIAEVARLILEGKIVAIRGMGGFHLAVDATNGAAVSRLRERKLRDEKPFALMVRDIDRAREIVEIDQKEERLLVSPQRPIVLLKRLQETVVADVVAPGMGTFGVMLPYAPLHHLLFAEDLPPLVMTSGNRSGEPIAIGTDDAVERLSGIADRFLVHNREILVRCDDSIAVSMEGAPVILRRSRGYVPKPIHLSDSYPDVLAVGGHLKAALCVLTGRSAFMSPYIGDMDTPSAREFFFETVALMKRITECDPPVVACDLHPGYFTTAAARGMEGVRRVEVQHHHAHVVSCMAENGVSGRVVGAALDGTGYGIDGTIWGGEFLVADESSFVRSGHLAPFRLPGGEAAVHEPWRTAASLLMEACGDGWQDVARKLDLIPGGIPPATLEDIAKNRSFSPLTTSMGRVFDGVAAILGTRRRVNFEGQAAMELEAYAGGRAESGLSFDIREQEGVVILDLFGTIRALAEKRIGGRSPEDLAAAFHRTLIRAVGAVIDMICDREGVSRVVLSGGCFQNRILLEGVCAHLQAAGREVYTHHRVPTNDGGIALGQAVSVGARLKNNGL